MEEYTNPNLVTPVAAETPLKEMIVNYIGERLEADGPEVTVEMAVEVFALEFPEFLLAVAEENFLRGYQQAFYDLQATEDATAASTTPSSE